MTTASSPIRMPLLGLLAACMLIGPTGCHPIDFYAPMAEDPLPAAMLPAREKELVSLPAYRISAPDVLQIEMIKQIPLPPYRAKIYDVLQIDVVGTLLDQPIANFYLAEAEGTVNLGPAYGTVWVVGMTIEEIKFAVTLHLRQILANPEVAVKLARASGTQPVTGEYLVGPDGTVNLRRYGTVNVQGKTVAEAAVALEQHLAQHFASPDVSVNVLAFNSKVYYILTEGANLGDNLVRVPITGKETVMDALSMVGGLSQLSSKTIWIARPAPGNFGCEQILPIDYDAITRGASTATNYQIMPGDRLFIAEDGMVALTNLLGKVISPAERLAGVASLYTSMLRGLQTFGRAYNKQRFR